MSAAEPYNVVWFRALREHVLQTAPHDALQARPEQQGLQTVPASDWFLTDLVLGLRSVKGLGAP